MKLSKLLPLLFAAVTPLAMFGFSGGPPSARTGVPADGNNALTCAACHQGTPVNSPGGRISISVSGYTPGVKQNITVTVEHPDAQRFGFQLTARLASDETKPAGSFTVTPDTRVRCGLAGATAPDAPCEAGAVQFASHTAASTRPGSASPATFTVEWTPPAANEGPVVFYAAGNAANNSGNNQGDRVYTTNRRVAASCGLTERPVIRASNGVTNAASFQPNITSNGLISVFGTGFAPANASARLAASDLVDGKWPTEFACVGLEVGGKRAPVFFVNATQINAQAPILDVTGPVDVRVIVNPGAPNELRSEVARVPVQTHSPAFFLLPGGIIAARNATRNNVIVGDPSAIPGAAPAGPGDILTLYGTGFGFTEPVYQPGEYATGTPRLRDPFTIRVGGNTLAPADILYAGLSGEAPGFYQFNIRLPAVLPAGNAAIVVSVGNVETQASVGIPVSAPASSPGPPPAQPPPSEPPPNPDYNYSLPVRPR